MYLWMLAAVVAYFIKGLCGFANTLVFTAILSFGSVNANISPIDLLLGYPANVILTWENRKNLDPKVYIPLAVLVLAGSIPGAFLLKNVDARAIKLVFGVVVVALGAEMLSREYSKKRVPSSRLVLAIIGVVGVLWIIAGWSFAYGGDGSNPFFGGFDQLGCASVVQDMLVEAQVVPEDAVYPAIIDVVFQAAFAMITCAIIWGAVAGRMKFGAMIAFVRIWVLVIYCPLAHMVWGGDGSFIGDQIGALDFAGGDVVHISSGLAGLVLCLLLGSRKEFGTVAHRPHNIPLVVLGVTLLWFGWFGFNAGSEFAADGVAGLALLNTVAASAAGVLSWMLTERITVGKCTLVGAATGLVAGLVVITPAAGFVEPWAAIVMGLIVSPIVYWAISQAKRRLGYDDALDAFGCHCVGGIVGAAVGAADPGRDHDPQRHVGSGADGGQSRHL